MPRRDFWFAGLVLLAALAARPAAGYEQLSQPPFPFYVPDMAETARLEELQGFLSQVESGRFRFEPAFFADVFEKSRSADTLQALFFLSFLRQSQNPAIHAWFREYAAASPSPDAYSRSILRQHEAEREPAVRMFALQPADLPGGRLSMRLFENPWEISAPEAGEAQEGGRRFLCRDAACAYEVQARAVPGLDEAGFLALLAASPLKQAGGPLFEMEVTRRGVLAFSGADRAFVELACVPEETGRSRGSAGIYLYERRTKTAYCIEHSLSLPEDSPYQPIASRLWSQMALVATLAGLVR